ncbi:hypothetical protein, partial [Bacteroides intestinalis]|uniref:hypothetical protein n=1 Tax=Bacteroides intestinalis TaxID=329854 RepID=UPI001C6FD496
FSVVQCYSVAFNPCNPRNPRLNYYQHLVHFFFDMNYLTSPLYVHSCFLAWKFSLLQMVTLVTPHGNSIYMLR